MELTQVKKNFHRQVRHLNGGRYRLTGCILRMTPQGEWYYQAELQDLKAPHSVLICRLEDISEGEET